MSKQIVIENTGEIVVEQLCIADTFWRRLCGLLGTRSFVYGQGMLIKPCSSVHTFGMGFAIDVVFLNKNFKVLKIVETLVPNRWAYCRESNMVLELPAGITKRVKLEVGQSLEWFELSLHYKS